MSTQTAGPPTGRKMLGYLRIYEGYSGLARRSGGASLHDRDEDGDSRKEVRTGYHRYRRPIPQTSMDTKAGALLAYGPHRLRAPVRSCARFPCGSHHVRNSWRASLLLVANGAGFAVATAVRRAYNDRYIRQYDDLNQSDRFAGGA